MSVSEKWIPVLSLSLHQKPQLCDGPLLTVLRRTCLRRSRGAVRDLVNGDARRQASGENNFARRRPIVEFPPLVHIVLARIEHERRADAQACAHAERRVREHELRRLIGARWDEEGRVAAGVLAW